MRQEFPKIQGAVRAEQLGASHGNYRLKNAQVRTILPSVPTDQRKSILTLSTKLTKNILFKAYDAKRETPMDKTTRIVRQMVDEETEQRDAKNSRLRNARLEREANTPPDTKAPAASKLRRKKAASTR
jgi:hypothetical protein